MFVFLRNIFFIFGKIQYLFVLSHVVHRIIQTKIIPTRVFYTEGKLFRLRCYIDLFRWAFHGLHIWNNTEIITEAYALLIYYFHFHLS